jgi:hypothetical protein
MADDCDAVLIGGVFNRISFQDDRATQLAIRQFVMTSEFSDVKSAVDAGLSVDAVIASFPIGVGGEFNQSNFETWKRLSQNEFQSSLGIQESLRFFQSQASKEILDAWVKCKSIRYAVRSGLSATLTDAGEGLSVLKVSWIPSPGDLELPRVFGVEIVGGKANSLNGFENNDTLLVGIDTNILIINREKGFSSDLVVLIKSSKGSVESRLPPVVLACVNCKGVGSLPCPTCLGKGVVKPADSPSFAFKTCGQCDGKGLHKCSICNGRGKKGL